MPANPVATRIPFTVIGGFLGAGKTTLLRHWLMQEEGQQQEGQPGSRPSRRRIAVLVNDFGELNLDAALIAQAGGGAIALSNGCVCCSIGDDLGNALIQLLDAWPPFDAVVVEASGVSDPWRIAQYALADPRLVLDGVIVLVDAAAVTAQALDPLLADTLSRPLAHADLIVLNKVDQTDATTLAAAHAWLAQQAPPGVPQLETVQAQVPLALLGAALYQPKGWGGERRGGEGRGGGGLPGHPAVAHDQRFESWAVQPEGAYDAQRLRAWLHTLPPAVLRLKALLPLADGRWAEGHWAGRHASLRLGVPAPDDGAALVAIGLAEQLPCRALADGLDACRIDPLNPNQERP